MNQAKLALSSQETLLKVLANLEKITPRDVWYDRVTLSPSTLALTAYAASLSSFGQFLTMVQTDPLFKGIRIDSIESSSAKGAQMQFDISMEIKK